ncbi:YybH family protein [Microbacterium sp. GXF7504]
MTADSSPTDETRAAILEVEARRQAALVAVDLEALAEVFEDSLVHIHAAGIRHTKEMLLEHTDTRRPYLEITRGDLEIRVFDDVAVMTGELTNRMRAPGGGERTLSGWVTQVLHRGADGAWRFVSFQMTPISEGVWGKLPSEQAAEETNQEKR